ncbi:S-adenosyl-L-methionine-dependent methyltransferase [Rhizophagus irregularis]|uniref:S-adenosyl-L-methionine-dependent methyltransferase n=1 Tax=Rhizophagus irregularis TaxID=588596 RepID=A0A2I1H9B9_9GLOM|nr:S-adenosyl-L-methionine-dependent methyltransferase [Rhizophagus irregularis]
MGNNISSSERKNKRIEFYKEIDNRTTDLEVEKELKYYIPNNYEDIDREHMFHFFQSRIFQNNFSSPIEERLMREGCKVLDIGCGPGTWLLDLASKYKKSLFYGLDNNSVYPNEIKPSNLNFIQADMFDGLPFPDNEFDFVRESSISFLVKADQWDFIISEMIRVTKPDGYVEFHEPYSTFNGIGPVLSKMHDALYKDEKSCILGPNGDKIGIVIQDLFMGFHNNEVAMENLSPILGISKEEYKIMIKDLTEEFKNTSPEYKLIRFWAKKN